MSKSVTYKITGNYPKSVITHNIDPSKIVELDELKINTLKEGSIYITYHGVLKEGIYDNIVNRIIFPSAVLHECSGYHRGLYDDTYVGAILVRTPDGKDILTFLYKYEDYENNANGKKYIEIHPITNPYEYLKSGNNCCKCQWGYKYPKRAVKIFDTFAEYKADKKAKEDKSEENLCATEKKKKVVQATTPVFSFTTPKFKIEKIIKETEWTSAKEGDTIYGEIPVITKDNGSPQVRLYGGNSYTNDVYVYVIDKFNRAISPLIFQKLFMNNYIVQEIK